jgi:hypothetical protein
MAPHSLQYLSRASGLNEEHRMYGTQSTRPRSEIGDERKSKRPRNQLARCAPSGPAMAPQRPNKMLTSIRIPQDSLEKAGYFEIVDQLALPHNIRWEPIRTATEAWDAIKLMKVLYLSLSLTRSYFII